jgi:hypothetical protein
MLTALLIAWFSGAATAAGVGRAVAQSGTRVVVLEISVPKKGMPAVHLSAREGETVKISVDGVGLFGFQPTLDEDDESTVTVPVFDLGSDPERRLGETNLKAGGRAVQSKTSPSFGIQVLRVTQPK